VTETGREILFEDNSLSGSLVCTDTFWNKKNKSAANPFATEEQPKVRYLDLHLEVGLEVGEESEEDGERELKDFRDRGDTVLRQCHTQVLLDGVDEHLVGLEDGPSILQYGQEQLEGQYLGAQLVGPGRKETGALSQTYNIQVQQELDFSVSPIFINLSWPFIIFWRDTLLKG
jgi:hypothetical protein